MAVKQKALPGMAKHSPRPSRVPGYKRQSPEADEQAALIRWARLWGAEGNPHRIRPLELLFAVPNGGYYLSPAAAGKLKAAGLLAGTWDLFQPTRRTDPDGWVWCGCWIEMKSARGVLSPDQSWFMGEVGNDYLFHVCRTWHEAARALLEYLGTPTTHPAWSGLEETK